VHHPHTFTSRHVDESVACLYRCCCCWRRRDGGVVSEASPELASVREARQGNREAARQLANRIARELHAQVRAVPNAGASQQRACVGDSHAPGPCCRTGCHICRHESPRALQRGGTRCCCAAATAWPSSAAAAAQSAREVSSWGSRAQVRGGAGRPIGVGELHQRLHAAANPLNPEPSPHTSRVLQVLLSTWSHLRSWS
jgi:hypothetical protein